MRLPRFRVRTLMIAVAAAGLLICGVTMVSRSLDYYRRARDFGRQEWGWRRIASQGDRDAKFVSECVNYFARLTAKYRRAIWRPWLPVAPDPHAPGFDMWLEQVLRAGRILPEAVKNLP
jgi:hypothetical protein